MSLRLLTPKNPPTPPPPHSSLSQSNPVSTSSETQLPPVVNQLAKTQADLSPEPELQNKNNQRDDEYYNKPRRGGDRRGGGRSIQSNEYSKRGRRGRGRMNYVPVGTNRETEETVDNLKPTEEIKPVSPIQTNEKSNITTKAVSGQNNPRRQNNNFNPQMEKYQMKYRPREETENNNVSLSSPTTPHPPQEEFELSLRNIHTNELRFSVLVKSSDVDKVLSFYSSLKPF